MTTIHSLHKKIAGLDAIPKRSGVYIVGGLLRDHLLGRDSSDIDISVRENPHQVAGQIADRLHSRVISLGPPAHPLFRVATHAFTFDVSALQGDSIESDLRRRDFTVNALAYETGPRTIVDVSQGIDDIGGRRIRQVSKNSFKSDPLRLLRAYRLASQLHFRIEGGTHRSLKHQAGLIRHSAVERVWMELKGILSVRRASDWLRDMAQTTILFHIFPELKALVGCPQGTHHEFDVFEHTLQTVAALEKLIHGRKRSKPARFPLPDPLDTQKQIGMKLAALLHDLGKPDSRQHAASGRIRHIGHDKIGARMTAAIGKRLKLSRQEIESAVWLVRHHLRPFQLYEAFKRDRLRSRGMTRFFMQTIGFTADVSMLSWADMRAKTRAPSESLRDYETFLAHLFQQRFTEFQRRSENPPLLNGHDLMNALQLTPSPLFSKILGRVSEAQLSGRIATKKEALALAAELASHM